jgi:antibiotic biosynthesis monooxygenase (ABM) superfamily enzyme
VIVYEVNLDVDAAVFSAYRAWLDEHVREMLTVPGFIAAEILECRDPAPPAGRRSLCVVYRLASDADLQRYLREDAPRLRAEGLQRFPGRFTATRRIMASTGDS